MKATFLQKFLIISFFQSCSIMMDHTLRVNTETNVCELKYDNAVEMDKKFKDLGYTSQENPKIIKNKEVDDSYIYLQTFLTYTFYSQTNYYHYELTDKKVCCLSGDSTTLSGAIITDSENDIRNR